MNLETLYDKMLSYIQPRTYSHFEGIEVFGTEKAAKDCERVAIQAQIDLLNKQNKKFLARISDSEKIKCGLSIDYLDRIGGSIHGFKSAIEINEIEIKKLETNLK